MFSRFLTGMALAIGTLSLSAQELDPVIKKSEAINASAAASQERVDKINDQIDDKLRQFRAVTKETERLEVYNQQLANTLADQVATMEQLKVSIRDASKLERQITPLMLRMIDNLEDFIELDVPFLMAERSERVAFLREVMGDSEASTSEKFRQVLRAYETEMNYGRSIETYKGTETIDGNEQNVEYLRIGRVALVYQTLNKQNMGVWNNQTRQWQPLDDSYRRQIDKGLRMAKEQMAPDLITIPVFSAK